MCETWFQGAMNLQVVNSNPLKECGLVELAYDNGFVPTSEHYCIITQ